MVVSVYINELKQQAESMNQHCIEIIHSMQQILQLMHEMQAFENEELQLLTTQLSSVATQFIKVAEELIQQNNFYVNLFLRSVAKVDVKKAQLMDQLTRINEHIEVSKTFLAELPFNVPFPIEHGQLHAFNSLRYLLLLKIESLDTYEQKTEHLYMKAAQLQQELQEKLKQLPALTQTVVQRKSRE